MSLDDALKLARQQVTHEAAFDCYHDQLVRADALADFIIDTLGVGFPCGWPEPTLVGRAMTVGVGAPTVARPEFVEWNGATMTRNEALGIAAAFIRRALELPEGE